MKRYPLLPFAVAAAFLLSGAACTKKSETSETTKVTTTDSGEKKIETEAKVSGPGGTTTSETTQVGSTLEAKTESKTDAGKMKVETYIGTVTSYKAGEKIEVTTAGDKKHSFDLNDKDWVVTVDPGVKLGSRVKLVEEKGDTMKKLTVRVDT